MKIACVTPDRKQDYLVETVLEGLHELGHELVVSDPGNGFCKKEMIDGDFQAAAAGCDLMLVFFGKQRGNRPPRRYFLDQVDVPKERVAYVDGSEWSATGWEAAGQAEGSLADWKQRRGSPWVDAEMLQRCGHYFKRETYPEDTFLNVVPLPFALRKRHILNPTMKDIDVFCSFGHTKTGLRSEAIEVAESFKRDGNLNVVVRSGMPPDEYRSTLERSRVVIDAWGGGDTTDRFWEGVGAKACVVYQRHNVITPDPFVDWEHAVSWSTKDELTQAIHGLMYGSALPETIGEKGFTHAEGYHTAKHRAQRILDTVFPPR